MRLQNLTGSIGMGVEEIYGFRENWGAFKMNLKDGIAAFANLS
jgi:hypothetical protein